jgi:hypothetical protein
MDYHHRLRAAVLVGAPEEVFEELPEPRFVGEQLPVGLDDERRGLRIDGRLGVVGNGPQPHRRPFADVDAVAGQRERL